MAHKKFSGTGVAIVTPFRNDGSIDFKSLGKLLEHIIRNGVNYIVPLGTTGESVTLSKDEKKAVVNFVTDTVNCRVPVVVGIGGNNTQEILDSVTSFDFNNVDGLLSVSPYYNKPSQQGILCALQSHCRGKSGPGHHLQCARPNRIKYCSRYHC